MATLNTYQNAVVDRYKAADGTTDYEKAWSYLDRIMGRELGKAGGLLTFNAVLIAVAIAMGPWWTVICPVVASLVPHRGATRRIDKPRPGYCPNIN